MCANVQVQATPSRNDALSVLVIRSPPNLASDAALGLTALPYLNNFAEAFQVRYCLHRLLYTFTNPKVMTIMTIIVLCCDDDAGPRQSEDGEHDQPHQARAGVPDGVCQPARAQQRRVLRDQAPHQQAQAVGQGPQPPPAPRVIIVVIAVAMWISL
jgi:hypothetical protein